MAAKARVATAAALVLACALVGCGGGAGSASSRPEPVDLLLDWSLNPAHAGILTAVDRGLDRDNGVGITVRTPPSSSDSVRLLLAGSADLAVMDIHDLALARERGRPVVAVMSIVGRPLAALIASSDVRRPRDLEGRTVAISGSPSDRAVTKAIVTADGGDPKRVRITPAGYAATQALLGGRAAAATGFLNEEGVSIPAKRKGFRVFGLDRAGTPTYPELVLVATSRTLTDRPEMVRRAVRAIASGTRAAVAEPGATERMLQRRLTGADRSLLSLRTRAALGTLLPPGGRAGALDPDLMRRWAAWEAAGGMVARPPDVDRLMTTRFSGR